MIVAGTILSVSPQPARGQTTGPFVTPLDPYQGALFGGSIAMDGDFAFITAGGAYNGGVEDAGAVYVFRFDGTRWIEEQKLGSSDPCCYFGGRVAVRDQVAIATSSYSDAAYIFRHDGTSWTEEQRVDRGTCCVFAPRSVAIYGDHALVGSLGEIGSGWGSVYAFRFNGASWVLTQTLTADDAVRWDQFGDAVALTRVDGGVGTQPDTALIGASARDNPGSLRDGAVYVFRFDGTSWQQDQTFTLDEALDDDRFGAAIAADGDLAVIGAAGEYLRGQTGSATLLRYDGTEWTLEQVLTASDGEFNDSFGNSVAVHDGIVVVGAEKRDGAQYIDTGAVYAFTHDGTQWVEEKILSDRFGYTYDNFGGAVAVHDGRVLAGIFRDENGELENAGRAYAYDPDLVLEASASRVLPGDPLTFTTTGGWPLAGNMLVAAGANGTPLGLVLTYGTFDASGRWSWSVTVPPDLSGLALQTLAIGIYSPGMIGESWRASVVFE